MPVVGSVVDAQTVVTLTDTQFTVTFPENNLTIVGIVHNAEYVSIPINASRKAVFPNAGGDPSGTAPTRIVGVMRDVNVLIDGTVLTYNIFQRGTTTKSCFYYGTPLADARPMESYAGVISTVTLSSGAGTGTVTFPAGFLKLTGITATMQGAAASSVLQLAWSISSGKTFNAFVPSGIVTAYDGLMKDIVALEMLPVAQTLSVAITLGTGADVVNIIMYYAK